MTSKFSDAHQKNNPMNADAGRPRHPKSAVNNQTPMSDSDNLDLHCHPLCVYRPPYCYYCRTSRKDRPGETAETARSPAQLPIFARHRIKVRNYHLPVSVLSFILVLSVNNVARFEPDRERQFEFRDFHEGMVL